MKRDVVLSPKVGAGIRELREYLVNELKLSEFAANKRIDRFHVFLNSLTLPADYALCRFSHWAALGYRCVVFERHWVLAYESYPEGVIVREIENSANLI